MRRVPKLRRKTAWERGPAAVLNWDKVMDPPETTLPGRRQPLKGKGWAWGGRRLVGRRLDKTRHQEGQTCQGENRRTWAMANPSR